MNNIQELPNIFNCINLNTGHYDDDSEDSEVILEMLNLRDSKGNQCFNVFEIDKYYERRIYFEKEVDYHKTNEEIKLIIEFSEKLGIEPSSHSLFETMKCFLKKMETEAVQAKEND